MGHDNNNAGLHLMRNRFYREEYFFMNRYDEILADAAAKKNLAKNNKLQVGAAQGQQQKKLKETPKNSMENKKDTSVPKSETKKEDNTKYLGLSDVVFANVMLIALQKKADILGIILDCEEKIHSDTELRDIPCVDKSMVLLSMIAERIGCSVYHFFVNDEDSRRQIVYDILDEIADWDEYDDYMKDENDSVMIQFSQFAYRFGLQKEPRRNDWRNPMDLRFYKLYFKEGFIYEISFGDLWYRLGEGEIYRGAYLYEEKEGKLMRFIERFIGRHPEWVVKLD